MRLAPALMAAALLGACDSAVEDRPAVTGGRAIMRPHVPWPPGTVPRGASEYAAALAAPGPAVTPQLLAYGEQRFGAFCTPCHGARGHGDGVVTSRGFPAPPSYHQERLREAPPAYIVNVITNGLGLMYPYAERIPPGDRWAIAHHVKRLQAEEAGRPPAPGVTQ